MKIADLCIHQPSYWPWLGLLDKVAKCKDYIILDDVQISKGTFQYRNIFLCDGKIKYLTIPARIHLGYTFRDITFNAMTNIRDHINSLINYYRKAKHLDDVLEIILPIYDFNYERPIELLVQTIKTSLFMFDIDTRLFLSSDYRYIGSKGEMVLDLCKKHGANSYLAGQGSKSYMGDYLRKFTEEGISVFWHNFSHPVYSQQNQDSFIPGLSCLDLLFNNGIERSREIFWNNVQKQQYRS